MNPNECEKIISLLMKRPIDGELYTKELDEFVSEYTIQTVTSGFVLYLIKQLPNENRKAFIDIAIKIIRQNLISSAEPSFKESKNKNAKEDFVLNVNKILQETKKKMESMFLD